MIKITLSNNLIAENCPVKVIEACKKALTIPNPAYFKVSRIAGPFAAQRDFKYYKINKVDPISIMMPRGFYDRFRAYLDKNGYEYEMTPDFVYKPIMVAPTNLWPAITLRDYQEPLLEAMLAKTEGVLALSTGGGKTVLACALARALGQTMTIIVPLSTIQNQFIEEFRKWFDYAPGIINGEKKEIKDITIAMWQSLSSDPELCKKLAGHTSVLIVDECHIGTSPERVKVLETFKPSRLYGLSGSPRKSKDSGQTDSIFFYYGPVIAEHMMPQIKPIVEVINTRVEIPININYAAMEDSVVANENRNKLIVALASCEAMVGRRTLILLKRVEHCRIIKNMLPDWGDLIYHADGEDKDRNETLMKMRSGERDFRILIGTTSMLVAGLDIPSLDILIFGASIKSDVMVQQGAGRICRLFSTKETAKVYDLFDQSNPIYRKQGYERINFYKSQQWAITGIDHWKK